MYKVIKYFTDLHDKDHPYNVGDTFPREGVKVTDERIAELASDKNKRGEPLIAEVVEQVEVEETEPAEEAPKKSPAKRTASKKATNK